MSCGRGLGVFVLMFQGSFDRGDHVLECLINVRSLRYWPPIPWRCQEFSEGQIVPVALPEDHRDYPCIASLMLRRSSFSSSKQEAHCLM